MPFPNAGNLDLEPKAPKLLVFDKELNKKMIASRAPAKSRKSGSGSQGSQIDGFDKESNKKIPGSRALAKSWKSGSGSQGSQIDGLDQELIK